MKTNHFGSHFEDQVSSVQTATLPTRGEASRIPGESTLGMYELDSMHNYLHWASMVWLLSLFI